jgi:DTW domain-containing protein YfiP
MPLVSKDEGISRGAGGHIDRAEYRPRWHSCRRPRAFCYCARIQTIDSEIRFVILTQPREAKHSFGTGRMAHLSLRNSLLVEGVDFSANERIHGELHGSQCFPGLLYPGKDSVNLSRQSPEERMTFAPAGRRFIVFVLDGTWKSARKMLRLSPNVANLPRICFEPPSPSGYRIRRQPKVHCYATIEAIHMSWICSRRTGRLDPLMTTFLRCFVRSSIANSPMGAEAPPSCSFAQKPQNPNVIR